MSKIIEAVVKNEIQHKELAPPGPRRAVLYLGDKVKFPTEYQKMVNIQIDKLKEIRLIQKLREKEAANDEDDNNDENQDNDREEIFLKKFPGFPSHYRRNKEIFRK